MTSRSQKVNFRLPQKRLTLTNENEVKWNHYKNPSGKIQKTEVKARCSYYPAHSIYVYTELKSSILKLQKENAQDFRNGRRLG